MRAQTKDLALSGILGALTVVILCMGSLIPFATYICPVLASLAVAAAGEECSSRYAWSGFLVAALLGLLLAPDKEIAMLFAFLGWYPLLKPRLDRLRPGTLRVCAKLLLGASTLTVMYALLLFVLKLEDLVRECAETSRFLLTATLLLGCVTFLAYDRFLARLTVLYRRRRGRASTERGKRK